MKAIRTDKDDKKGFDVIISTPSRKSPMKTSIPKDSVLKESTQVLFDVDPLESMTVNLFDQDTKERVKSLEIPIKDLQSNLTSSHLFHDGITVLIEYEITRDGKKISSTDDKLDEIINAIGFAEKPWYLETSTLYSALKLTLMRIFVSVASSEAIKNPNKAVKIATDFIVAASDLIKSVTLYKQLFTKAEADVILEQIDTYITAGLEKFDYQTDNVRGSLADALSELRFAIISHADWAATRSKEQKDSIVELTSAKLAEWKAVGIRFVVAAKDVLVWFSNSKGNLNVLLLLAYQYYDATKALVDENMKRFSRNGKIFLGSYLDKKFADEASWAEILTAGSSSVSNVVLVKAQPYIHKAVTWSTPYIAKVASLSKPYLITAAPYASSVVKKVLKNVENNKSAEQFIDAAAIKGMEVLEISTAYAIPDQLSTTYEEIFTLRTN